MKLSLPRLRFDLREDLWRVSIVLGVVFLINFGFGLEYQLTQSLFLGSQMMFNFLPKDTLGENFFYSWQIVGARVAF